jgi:hypothetical protein
MLKDGTYAAWYKTPLDQGTGIVHVADGQIWGCDSLMTYHGSCKVDGDRFTATVIKRSLRIRKLIFRDDSLNFLRLALDAVSETSIGLDGHMLDDGVNHRWLSCGTSLWALGLVANVFIQLVGIRHISTSNSRWL